MYYSSITLMRFSIFTIGSCIVIFSRDVGGQQQLPLQVSVDRTVCNSAVTDNNFLANEDRIIIAGTLDLTGKNPDDWPVYFPVESTEDKSTFQVFCTVDPLKDGCSDRRTTDCYCKSNTSNSYDIVVNQTLPLRLNGLYLRVSWSDVTLTRTEEFYTSKLNIYPRAKAMVSITDEDGKEYQCTNLSNENCAVDVTDSVRYSINFSVSGLEDPTLTIKFDEGQESSRGPDSFVIEKNFTGINRTIEARFSFQENGGCRRSSTFVVFFKFTSDSDSNELCSWVVLVTSLLVVVVGTLMIAISVQGDKHGWCSWLKHKSKEDDVGDKEIKKSNKVSPKNRLPPLNSPPPASANGTKPKPTATTTSDEDRTKKKRKKNKVTGGESEKKNTEKETPEKETPEERKTPEKKQRKTKKAGESDEGAEQTDQVRPLPSPRMVGEPGFNTSSTSPVNLRSNFSASLAHQGIKSDTRPPSIEVTTRALPKPKKK